MPKRKRNKIVGWIADDDMEQGFEYDNEKEVGLFSISKNKLYQSDVKVITMPLADYEAMIEEAAMAIAAVHCGNCPYSDKCDTNGKTKKQHGSIQQCTTQWKRHLRSITVTPKARENKQ